MQTLSAPVTNGNTRPLQSWASDVLVQCARDGQTAAMDELMRRHHQLLFRTAFRILKNNEDAEDTVQDVLLKAFTHLDSFRGDSSFSTWLVRITMNASLMHLRKLKVRSAVSLCDSASGDSLDYTEVLACSGPTPEAAYMSLQEVTQLHSAVARLPNVLRETITLRLRHDHSIRTLAELSGITQAAAKSRLMRARLALAEDLTGSRNRSADEARPAAN